MKPTEITNQFKDEIVRLYQCGMSQKDISAHLGIGLKQIRALLRWAGFNTSEYRRIPHEYEDAICVLLGAGVSYRAISEATDISFHVIRDIAERRSVKHVRHSYRRPDPGVLSLREQEFLTRYRSGESFCAVCADLSLGMEELLRCYSLLDLPARSIHSEALCRRLQAEDLRHTTERSLARKYGISISVVKAYLNR